MLNDPIARRYFVMNFFDGIMTTFGMVVGGAVSIGNSLGVLRAGIGASIAIMMSGFFGAYMSEKAEQKLELRELEKLLLRPLNGTILEKRGQEKIMRLAIIDAVSPFFGAIIPIIPFFLNLWGFISYNLAIISSLGLSFLLLISLGVYLGRLMDESPWKSALVFAIGGLIVGLLSSVFEHFIN
ncbi:MAG: hypothetical protein GOV01_03000 [Candidatus Altiarchaeota archaeon]|nr:hypothetical protein [Candidatus Altiarchaeota archaeon]